MNENLHDTKRVLGIAPGVYKNAVNPTAVVIDRAGFNSVALNLVIGACTDAQTLNLQESDVSGSGYTDVVAGDVIGNLATWEAAVASGNANTVQSIGYIGKKRYLQILCTGAGSTGGAFAIVAELSNARKGPATATLA